MRSVVLACALVLLPATPSFANRFLSGRPADLVLGQPDFTSNASDTSAQGLSGPQSVTRDPATGKVFVCDSLNNRILR
jgi:hypothetical protein